MDNSEQATERRIRRIQQVRRRVLAARQLVHTRSAHLDDEPRRQVDEAHRLVRQAEVESVAGDAMQLLDHAEALADCAYEMAAETYGQDKDSWTAMEFVEFLFMPRRGGFFRN